MSTASGALLSLSIYGCGVKTDMQRARESLMQTDRQFSELSIEKGALAAFDRFMSDDAVIFRNRVDPVVGRDPIRALMASDTAGTLIWEPYFADVAASGDLGYTLGRYEAGYTDSAGVGRTAYGKYVTIWKKQPDGTWRFVFDTGSSSPPPR